MIGREARISGSGVGDAEPAEAVAPITGASVAPPSPVHLKARLMADGTTLLSWTRRSRSGWRWIDGADAPLGEERERYRVTATADGTAWQREADTPQLALAPADRAATLALEVRQLGTNGASPPAMLVLPAI
jgi:hypothetical protein